MSETPTTATPRRTTAGRDGSRGRRGPRLARAGALTALAFAAAAALSGCTLIQTLSEASEIPEPDAWMTESPSATSTPVETTSAPTPSATTSPTSVPSSITYVADPREIEAQIVTTIKSELNVDVTAKCPDDRIEYFRVGTGAACESTDGVDLRYKITGSVNPTPIKFSIYFDGRLGEGHPISWTADPSFASGGVEIEDPGTHTYRMVLISPTHQEVSRTFKVC